MRASAMQRRAAALLHGKGVTVKLWEEPDLKSETDDACGGRRSFWAERLKAAARTPAILGDPARVFKETVLLQRIPPLLDLE